MLPETIRQGQQSSSSWGGSAAASCSSSKSPEERRRCSRRVLATGLLSLSVAFLLVWESGSLERLAETPIRDPGRVLLVTAHPDDEVIFFASTISALHASGREVFLLCLTNGKVQSCSELSVNIENLTKKTKGPSFLRCEHYTCMHWTVCAHLSAILPKPPTIWNITRQDPCCRLDHL